MEIELYSKLQNATDIEKLGMILGKSGMFGVDKAEAGVVILMTCAVEKITPLQFCRTYDFMMGKPRKKAMAAYAEFRQKGAKVLWVATGNDGKEAIADVTFEGQTIRFSFSIEQARKQGLVKPNSAWEKTPGNMLRARLLSNAIGMLCPEIYAGAIDDAADYSTPESTLNIEPIKPGTVEVLVETVPTPMVFAEAGPHSIVEAKAEAAAGLAPVTEEKNGIAPTPQPVSEAIPSELAGKVEEAIGEHAVAAINWMLKEKWLTPGQNIGHLTPIRANRIINQRDSFIRAITATGS